MQVGIISDPRTLNWQTFLVPYALNSNDDLYQNVRDVTSGFLKSLESLKDYGSMQITFSDLAKYGKKVWSFRVVFFQGVMSAQLPSEIS